jgi:hypothetical protein
VLSLLLLGETSAWLGRLIGAAGLACASASFRNALLRARFILFSTARTATAVASCFAASKVFFIFLDKGAVASATRHFFQLFESS